MHAIFQLDADIALLWDKAALGAPDHALFAPDAWPHTVGTGRGAARGRDYVGRALVWRHYRRGGLPARLFQDRYLFTGWERTRPFREFELTAELHARGLPVPRVVVARVVREGLCYRGDLVTERLPARPLPVQEAIPWRAVGETIARFHRVGLDHADLNARNLLADEAGRVWLIDLDRGRLRPPGRWRQANLARLRRSLKKLGRFDQAGWAALEAGYARYSR